MRVVCIANFKGGTGKTVTACNLAAELAARDRTVLLIDADPQHNASDFYFPERDENDPTLYDVLAGYDDGWENAVTPTKQEGLYILPADMRLLTLDLGSIVNGSQSRVTARFDDFVQTIRRDSGFDYVIIDCPPSFTAASVAALLVSDDVILPTKVDAFSRAGVCELLDQIRGIGQTAHGLRFYVLITMADRTNLSRQGEELLRASGLPVCQTVIRSAVAVGESTYARCPLREYAPKSTAARDYEAFVKEYREEAERDG